MTTSRIPPSHVFVVWDRNREEHGEGKVLIDIYATRTAAEEAIKDLGGGETYTTVGDDGYDIEKRKLIWRPTL